MEKGDCIMEAVNYDWIEEEKTRITLEEYEALPEDVRVEIFEGFAQNMASPSRDHQRISTRLVTIISNYIIGKNGGCEVFHAPFDVKLSDDPLVIVQPDILVVCDRDKLDEKRCNGAPDFIIEIVSPGNASHDYVRKLGYYKDLGVREYWILDPDTGSLSVYYFEGGIYCEHHDFTERVRVHICEDLEIDLAQVAAVLR